jgi:hypothetical protein
VVPPIPNGLEAREGRRDDAKRQASSIVGFDVSGHMDHVEEGRDICCDEYAEFSCPGMSQDRMTTSVSE